MTNMYRAAVGRETMLDAGMTQVAERMFSGSFAAMASFLVSNRKLNDADKQALRRLLDEHDTEEKK